MLRPKIEGTRFKSLAKHKSLKWILKLANATSRPARWRLLVFKFEFDICHDAGIKRQAASALCCVQKISTYAKPIEHDLPVGMMNTATTNSSKVRLEEH